MGTLILLGGDPHVETHQGAGSGKLAGHSGTGRKPQPAVKCFVLRLVPFPKTSHFPRVFDGFLERRIRGKNGHGSYP